MRRVGKARQPKTKQQRKSRKRLKKKDKPLVSSAVQVEARRREPGRRGCPGAETIARRLPVPVSGRTVQRMLPDGRAERVRRWRAAVRSRRIRAAARTALAEQEAEIAAR